jgi:hypothetical protein
VAKRKTKSEQPQTAPEAPYTLPAGHALVLRCCAPDMGSKNGFVWPGVGEVAEASDWKKNRECGNGLHGWLYGQGDHGCSDYWHSEGAKWLVVEVEESTIVMLGGKCKFPRGVVRFVGAKHEAAAFIVTHEPRAKSVAVIGHVSAVGDGEVAAVGALGTATAGDSGTATAGALGTATAGDSGTATAGYSGTATAGYSGTICIRYWDAKAERYRTKVGYIGEDGLKPDTAYRLDDEHRFAEVTP